MMHAKTAVVDGRWARVGSTNLNIASWLNNWELDVFVEDTGFGQEIQEMFIEDLKNSTEIVLDKNRPRPVKKATIRRTRGPRTSGTKAAAGVVRLGHAVGAAIASRELGPAEAVFLFWIATLLTVFSTIAIIWPRSIAWPAAVIGLWISTLLFIRAYRQRRRKK